MADRNALLDEGVPTIASSGAPQVANPLAAISAANTAASGMYDLRQKQAQEAAGQAFLNSIDPNTGQPNQPLLMQNLRNSPASAMSALAASTSAQAIDHNTFVTQMARLTGVGNAAMGLVAQHPDGVISQDEINNEIAVQGQKLGLSPQQIAQAQAQFGPDGRQNYAMILRNHAANLSAQQALLATRPTAGTQDLGGQVTGTQAAPALGTQPPGAISPVGQGIDYGLTPEQRAARVTWKDANGVEQTTTVDEMHKRMRLQTPSGPAVGAGAPGAPAAAAPPAGAPSITPPKPPPGTTVRSGGGSGPAAPPAPTTPVAPQAAAPAGATISGPAPGTAEAKIKTAEGSAAAGEALRARGDQVPTNKANYANMLTDISKIQSMGPGTEREAYINSLLQKWTGTTLGTMTPEQIAASDSFAKLANIAVGQQLAAIGGTDARQALFMGSNPRLDLSKLSNTQLTNMLNGNEDAIQAKSRAWQAWLNAGNGPHTYGKFQDDFNHHFDPRVFQSQYMGPDEIAALRASMTGPDGNLTGAGRKFLDDVAHARKQRWIQ
jgi:hypothetical protein